MGRWRETTVARRFMERVEYDTNGGCWLWSGAVREGYGRIRRGKRVTGAHRVSYEMFVEDIPAHGPTAHGMVVRHKCDVTHCVNPAHLELGTQRENVADREARGRTSQNTGNPGEASPLSRLTNDQVLAIRRRHAGGEGRRALASEYGVAPQTIWKIITRASWAHI